MIKTNDENKNNKSPYDLEDRTLKFAKDIRVFVKKIPKNISNIDDIKQLVRSSGSIGANYIEANEALSRKDFINRIKISRKESKESKYWLCLLEIDDVQLKHECQLYENEGRELMLIFSAIMHKSKI